MTTHSLHRQKSCLTLFLLLIYGSPLVAERVDVRLAPDIYYQKIHKGDGFLDWEELAEAALYASGVLEENLSAYSERIASMVREIERETKSLSPYDKGDWILRYMHQNLESYEELQTRLDTLLVEGTFNCVSSALLFAILARSVGLKAEGISTTDHAFCRIETANDFVDVETTNLYGFDPGTKKEFKDQFTEETGYVYVEDSDYANSKILNDAAFLALILQNRLYLLESERKTEEFYSKVIPLTADLWFLVPDEVNLGNRVESLLGLAIFYERRGDFKKGINLINREESIYGSHERLTEVRKNLSFNHIIGAMNAKEWIEAEDLYGEYFDQGYFTEAEGKRLNSVILYNFLVETIKASSFDESRLILDNKDKKTLSVAQMSDLYVYLFSLEINRLQSQELFLECVLLLEKFPDEIKRIAEYKDLSDLVRNNYLISVHNSFARFYNAGNYKDAEKAVNEGLMRFPDAQNLIEDLALLKERRE